jgi:thiol-disulfide isomerase/thioredoxin
MKFILIAFFLIQSIISLSQTSFNVKIVLPEDVPLEMMRIMYNIGYREILVDLTSHNCEIKDTTFTKYAVVTVSDLKNHYQQLFFINSLDSEIKFIPGTNKSFVKNFVVKNAISVADMGEKKLYKSAKKEIEESADFVRKYVDFSVHTDSINDMSKLLEDKSRAKQYEFIRKNNKLYYSLWLFKYNFVNSAYYNAEKLYPFYLKYLKKNFKGFFESKQIEEILSARINNMVGKMAPIFITKDISGQTIDLSNLKGKYVILDFWAPWCAPCIAEMPVFDSIYKTYGPDKIEIISINCDDNAANFKNAIKKNNMHWINIYNDERLINQYGKTRSLPQVYLIDKDGRIIYSREEDKDYDLSMLRKIIEKLQL